MTEQGKSILEMNPFRSIFEASVEAIVAVDADGRIVMSNPSACKLFGYTKSELEKLKVEDLIPQSLRNSHVAHRESYDNDPHPRTMGKGLYLQGLKKDGTEFPIEVSLSRTEIEEQTITVAFVIDISKRKQLEKQNQMYLDVAGAIFIVVGRDEIVQMINNRGVQLLGVAKDEVEGKNWFSSFVPMARRAKSRSEFKRIFDEDISQGNIEEHIINKEGKESLVSWHYVLVKNQKGVPESFLGSGIDITAEKKAEIALRKSEEKLIVYAAQLEKMVGKRTKELDVAVQNLKKSNQKLEEEILIRQKAEEEVRRALAKERELNELKSRFVSMASHEFRTPLSTILSSASLIDRYEQLEDDSKSKKHVKRIKSNVGNLTNLLNDFLSLEKLEKGKISSNYSEFDFNLLVLEVIDEMSSITKTGQVIESELDKRIGSTFLDKNMVKNILNNLISNASKYSSENATISIQTSLLKDEKLKLTVIDHGMGIPKSEHNHLFERFFRAANASNIQGTGLGLYIVKKYVEEMQGSITFASVLDTGTTFEITLPVTYDKDPAN